MSFEIDVATLKQRMDAGERLCLIDCREPEEWAIARIEGADLIPMRTIPAELQRIEGAADEMPVVVYCHHGVRSLQVVSWLRGQGVENTVSLAGGIERWSTDIDRSVPRY